MYSGCCTHIYIFSCGHKFLPHNGFAVNGIFLVPIKHRWWHCVFPYHTLTTVCMWQNVLHSLATCNLEGCYLCFYRYSVLQNLCAYFYSVKMFILISRLLVVKMCTNSNLCPCAWNIAHMQACIKSENIFSVIIFWLFLLSCWYHLNQISYITNGWASTSVTCRVSSL